MTPDEARAVLGVNAGADWTEIRAAYRARIRVAHPDIAGGTTSDASLALNAAYRTLAKTRHSSPPDAAPVHSADRCEASVKRRARPASDGAPGDVRILDGSTLVLSSTPAETFRRLVEATSALGEISYIDRSSAIFEAVLGLEDGTHASFVVSLQWRAHDATCEAFCTLEALERAESLDVTGVLEQLLPHIPPDREA